MRTILLLGPPGSGKTMKARALAAGLPAPSGKEASELGLIFEAARLKLQDGAPYRAPHHTVSEAGLAGGGTPVRPGEVSLAHCGCLMLDELAEFRRQPIERLAEAIGSGEFRRAQSGATMTRFAARPALIVATSNLCACGYLGSSRPCTCSPSSHGRWQTRLFQYASLLGIEEFESLPSS